LNPQGKPEFTAFLKSKEFVAWLSTLSNEGTHDTYSSCLFNYSINQPRSGHDREHPHGMRQYLRTQAK